LPQVTMTFFAAASLMITIPSGIQVFAWTATLLTGKPVLRTPLLFVLGFVVVFVVGGLSGVMFAAIPFDQQVTDTYFVVAHFHYVLMGAAGFRTFPGINSCFRRLFARSLADRLPAWRSCLFLFAFTLPSFPLPFP